MIRVGSVQICGRWVLLLRGERGKEERERGYVILFLQMWDGGEKEFPILQISGRFSSVVNR